MTDFKQCKIEAREFLLKNKIRHCFLNYTTQKGWFYTKELIPSTARFCLEKNGVVDKIIDGHWLWDFEKRGMHPENDKGWNKRMKNSKEINRRLKKRGKL